MNRIATTALTFAVLCLLGACAAPAVQQPAPTPSAQLRQDANAAFGDLRNEEDRAERRDDGCRSNGDATTADKEDCKILDE